MGHLMLHLENHHVRARLVEGTPQGKLFKWKGLTFELSDSNLLMMRWSTILTELSPDEAKIFLDLIGARYPFSPEFKKIKKTCPDIAFNKKTDEWVFFGGSFNPWHNGHEACLKLLGPAKTCFILPDRNPHKNLSEVDPVVSVLELAHVKFEKNQFLAPTFILDQKKNPTVEWIERLRKDYPSQKLSLLIGFDSLKDIQSWTRAHELLNYLDCLYIASRLEVKSEQILTAQSIRKEVPKLHVEFLGHHEFEELSATKLRNRK